MGTAPKLMASEMWGLGAHRPWPLIGRVPYAATMVGRPRSQTQVF